MDGTSVAITVSATTVSGSDAGDDLSGNEAFSASLDAARDQLDDSSATIQITVSGTDDAGAEEEVVLEIETVVFSGEELSDHLSATNVLGGGAVAQNHDGTFGVAGSVSGDRDLRIEVGETLTFDVPPSEGDVIGGQVTITNLISDEHTTEGALVIAYDADDQQVAWRYAIGNEEGTVTVDINVPFARLDFKALDNDSWVLQANSNFGVSDIATLIASKPDPAPVEDVADAPAGQSGGLAEFFKSLLDFGHFGKVTFEVNRISLEQTAIAEVLQQANFGRDADQKRYDDQVYTFRAANDDLSSMSADSDPDN